MAASPEGPRATRSQKRQETDPPVELLEEAQPCRQPDADFKPSELFEAKHLLCTSTVFLQICFGRSGELTWTPRLKGAARALLCVPQPWDVRESRGVAEKSLSSGPPLGTTVGEALMRSCVSQDALQGQGCCGQEGGVGEWLQKVLEHEKPQDSALPLWPAPPHLPVGYWLQVLFLHLSGKLHLLVALAREPQVSWTRGPKRCPLGGVAKGHSTHITEGGA